MKMFSVYDKKAEGYKPAFCVQSIGEAERAFGDACMKEGTDLQLHPEDYQLWLVGNFDEFSGEVTPERTHVCNGISRFEQVSAAGVMPIRGAEHA